MYRIAKEFRFSASHQLVHLRNPEWDARDERQHQCSRMHGHNYRVEVELAAAELNAQGMVRDYGELAALGQWIDQTLDHRHLNDVFAALVPCTGAADRAEHERRVAVLTTAEQLARWLYAEAHARFRLREVVAVRVSETEKTWAEYRPAPVPAAPRPHYAGAAAALMHGAPEVNPGETQRVVDVVTRLQDEAAARRRALRGAGDPVLR